MQLAKIDSNERSVIRTKNYKFQGRVKYPKERLLLEVYRMRGLTLKQIERAIFGSYDYAYEYMTKLEKEGLVQGKVYNSGKKRLGKLYTLTDTGIERLVAANLVQEPSQSLQGVHVPSLETKNETSVLEDTVPFSKPKLLKAYANNQGYDKHRVIYTLLTNELYAEITRYGMYFFDAREWKVRYNLNRNAIVRGGFIALDGQEYSLYVLFSPEQYKTASVSENMLTRIVEEITLNQQDGEHILYIYNEEKYDWIIEQLREMQIYQSNLHIIRHNNGKGYEKLRLLSHREKFRQSLSNVLQLDLPVVPNERLASRYAHYDVNLNGHPFYLFNFLTHNEGALKRLFNEFNSERSKIENHQMGLLIWESDFKWVQQMIGTRDHIRIRYISDQQLENLSFAEPLLLTETPIWKTDAANINNYRLNPQNP